MADEVADMEVDEVTDMVVDMVADMEVDKVANEVTIWRLTGSSTWVTQLERSKSMNDEVKTRWQTRWSTRWPTRWPTWRLMR